MQDNAPIHTARVATAAASDCGFEILPHPPYSPDLAPSDYYLFPKLKSHLSGQRYSSNNDVMYSLNEFFAEVEKNFFFEGLEMFPKLWNKCIAVKGDYVEK